MWEWLRLFCGVWLWDEKPEISTADRNWDYTAEFLTPR
jgi:hypothetical protein